VNTHLNNFHTNTYVPVSYLNAVGSNNNLNLANDNNFNNNYFLENKLKLISLVLEKHIEQFVTNNNNYANNLSNDNNNNNLFGNEEGNKENNTLKFSQIVKNVLKSFSADLNFKLKSLLEYNLPLDAYARNSSPNVNTNGISSNKKVKNCNNPDQNQAVFQSRNNNRVYSNIVKNMNINNYRNNINNQDLIKSD